jgi:hypothetical protein
MLCVSPEGRQEALWVEEHASNLFRVLSVPVWLYGISKGSIVEADQSDASQLRFVRVWRDSDGGTVRFVVPKGNVASDVYLSRVIPDALREGLFIGPATFFNPRLVSVHVHSRFDWWPKVGSYLDALVAEGVLEAWEIGDPDQYASEHQPVGDALVKQSSVLRHPLPVDGALGQHLS